MRKTIVTRVLVMLLLFAVFTGTLPVSIQATESVSENDMAEKQNQLQEEEYPLMTDLDLWSLDW